MDLPIGRKSRTVMPSKCSSKSFQIGNHVNTATYRLGSSQMPLFQTPLFSIQNIEPERMNRHSLLRHQSRNFSCKTLDLFSGGVMLIMSRWSSCLHCSTSSERTDTALKPCITISACQGWWAGIEKIAVDDCVASSRFRRLDVRIAWSSSPSVTTSSAAPWMTDQILVWSTGCFLLGDLVIQKPPNCRCPFERFYLLIFGVNDFMFCTAGSPYLCWYFCTFNLPTQHPQGSAPWAAPAPAEAAYGACQQSPLGKSFPLSVLQ